MIFMCLEGSHFESHLGHWLFLLRFWFFIPIVHFSHICFLHHVFCLLFVGYLTVWHCTVWAADSIAKKTTVKINILCQYHTAHLVLVVAADCIFHWSVCTCPSVRVVVMFILFHCPVRKLVSAIGNRGMSLVSLLDVHQENTQSILQWGYLRESLCLIHCISIWKMSIVGWKCLCWIITCLVTCLIVLVCSQPCQGRMGFQIFRNYLCVHDQGLFKWFPKWKSVPSRYTWMTKKIMLHFSLAYSNPWK